MVFVATNVLENITQTNKILQQKRDVLPDLHNALREATQRFQEAEMAREQKKKADELKKELAWAHVKKKEIELTKGLEDVAKQQRRLPRIRESLQKAEVHLRHHTMIT